MDSTDSKHSTSGGKNKDLKTFGTLVMTLTCIMTPLSVIYHNPRYFFASEAFADGGDLYSHFTEANYIKEALQSGGTNFWFSHTGLGYPLITAYQPLPGFFIAICMLIFERFLSPLLIFRLIFVTVLAFIPVAIHKSAQVLGLKQTEQIILCLLSFAIQSWRRFGLEIPAFVDYGLLTQAFGMLILFPAVSILYRWILMNDCRRQDSTLPTLVLSVSFLTNLFFGILTCILAGTMVIVNLITSRPDTTENILKKLQSFSLMLATSLLLISWWVLSCFAGYNYIGGLPWRGESEDGYRLSFIADSFSDGEMFDSNRFFPWFTILVLLGITICCINMTPATFRNSNCTDSDKARSLWLLLSAGISFLLFLGRTTFSFLYDLIPLHAELETVKYLSALHFCGLLFASHALSEAIDKLSEYISLILHTIDDTIEKGRVTTDSELLQAAQFIWRKAGRMIEKNIETLAQHKNNAVKVVLVLAATGFLWHNHFHAIGTHLTVTEVNHNFIEQLRELRNDTKEGRLLGNRILGTANAFDLAFIPLYTGKPGLMTYSRGYHDSLSLFYLESLKFNPEKTPLFVNSLRLYNVHFLVTSDIKMDAYFANACQLKYITKVDDLVFYEVLHQENDYGYFDFIRIPGHIRGDLKLIRQAALAALELYKVNSLLMINPEEDTEIVNNVVVDVSKVPIWSDLRGFAQKKTQVTWSLNGKEEESQTVIDKVVHADSWKWVYSQVIEEEVVGNDYHAIVHVSDRGYDLSLAEHILLKVTYHPFWKCYYYRVSDDFTLDMYNSSHLFDGKMYAHINHVIPNLMSISLPPGRYFLIFTYRFPGLFKILILFCALGYIRLLFKCLSEFRVRRLSQTVETVEIVDAVETVGDTVDTMSTPLSPLHEEHAIMEPEVPNVDSPEETREAFLRNRNDEDTLPNFRLRKGASSPNNMRDWQVLVRATLQRRRIVHELEQVFATKDKSRSSERRGNPPDSESKLGNSEVDKLTDVHMKSVTSKPASSAFPARPYKEHSTAGAHKSTGSSKSKHYSSTSSISEASASENEASSERSDTRIKPSLKNSSSVHRNVANDHIAVQGFVGGPSGSSRRNSLSQDNRNYLLDINANFTSSKRTTNGSSNRSRDAHGSKLPPLNDPRSSDSSGGEDHHGNMHGRSHRASLVDDLGGEKKGGHFRGDP